MKKTFLKVALFSLVLGALPATTLTSCKDYDSDIDGLNQRDDALQKEINDKLAQQEQALKNQMAALQTALDEQKAEAARANAAAEAAAQAAAAAQTAADNAQKAGDQAAADAATAQAAAEAANAEALLAQKAAAEAKADAIAEAQKQVAALEKTINDQIAALKAEYGDKIKEVADAVAQAATKTELQDAVNTLQQAIASSKLTKAEIEEMLADYIAAINKNTVDIAALSGKIDGISVQITTLEGQFAGMTTDLNTLKNDLTSLQTQVTANKNDIAANAAAIAAETTRINNIVNTTIPGIESEIAQLTTDLANLTDKFDTLDGNFTQHLAEYAAHISAFNTFKTQVETQLAALDTFKESCETTLAGIATDITDLQTRIGNAETDLTAALAEIVKNTNAITDIKGDITTINGNIDTINGDIEELQGLITDLKGKDTELQTAIDGIQTTLNGINQSITKINGALSTLNSINAKRLTSITLVPTAYVGGIPTIEFYSASFTPMGALDQATGIYAAPAATAQPVLITNNDTKVLYRMNPVGVSLTDIVPSKVAFVQQTATSRAAETPVIKVAGVDKDEATGNLVITATKADGVTNSIDNAGAGKIYTVALQVPIAPKNYYTWTEDGKEVPESAEDAVVYSEYCRLSESSFVPEIAHVDAETGELAEELDHFSTSAIWTASPAVAPVVEVPYNGTYDLSQLVAGCMFDDQGDTDAANDTHTIMTAEQLESFGFSFVFSIPAKEYTVDGVNQQEYATVNDGILTPALPATPAGLTAASRVNKTPIVSVVMMRGTQVVEQKFFIVKYVIAAETEPFNIDVFTEKLSCEPYTETVSWTTLNDEVISQLGFPMSQAEFVANYTLVEEVDGVTVDLTAAADKAPITWTVGLDEFASMNGKDKELQKVIKFESTTFPEITINLNGVIEWPSVLPTIGETAPFYWNNGVMQILPVAMPTEWAEGDETVSYKTDVFLGRMTPYLTNLEDCAEWDVQISKVTSTSTEATFEVGAEAPDTDDTKAYTVVNGEETAASIWYAAEGEDAHQPFSLDTENASELMSNFFFIENNESGIELVETESTVSLGWYIFLNGVTYDNSYVLNNTELKIIKPLKSVNAGEIKPLTQANTVQTRDLAEGMTVTDCYNVAFDDTENLWKYYDITEVTWSNEVVITDASGKVYDPKTLNIEVNVSEDGVLTFTGSGIALQESYTIEVPVTVAHKWGKLVTTVPVTVNPNTEI